MAKVQIQNVLVLDNPAPFLNPLQFEITFECLQDLEEDLEWKIIYVGSAESESHDQVLDNILVGPVSEGRHKFVFQAPAPDVSKIPVQDALGVTVILLTCGYRDKEFVRCGYYVNNEYSEPELKETPPAQPEFDKMVRNILAERPRVTRFTIDWGDGVLHMEDGESCGMAGEEDGAGDPVIDAARAVAERAGELHFPTAADSAGSAGGTSTNDDPTISTQHTTATATAAPLHFPTATPVHSIREDSMGTLEMV